MKKLSRLINKINNGWVTLICLVIFLLFTAFVLPMQAEQAEVYSADVGSPDSSFYYSAEKLYEFAEAYGPVGRRDYIQARFTFDVIWPLVYLVFLATAISWAVKQAGRVGSLWQQLNLLPVFGLIFDYFENITAAIVMARFPDLTPIMADIAGIFTTLKWLSIGGSFTVLVIALLLAGWRWIGSKTGH